MKCISLPAEMLGLAGQQCLAMSLSLLVGVKVKGKITHMSSCKPGGGYGQPMSPQNEIKRSGNFTLKPPTVGQKVFAVAPHY